MSDSSTSGARIDEWVDRINSGSSVDEEEAQAADESDALRALALLNFSTDSDEPAESLVGTTLGPYRLEGCLGEGGQGRVYEAVHDSLGRRVALKVLPQEIGRTRGQVARFWREARAVASLKHEGIVPVFELGEAAGTHFFAMELVDGASLSELLDERKKSRDADGPGWDDPRWAVSLALDCARALGFAHRQGVIHRDVKPSNVLVGSDGRARLTDFGLARIEADPGTTRSGIRLGTLSYMSPEHVDGKALDPRSDVFSLGVTLYELVTLERPFAGRTEGEVLYRISHDEPQRPRRIRPSADPDLEAIILKALDKDPDLRYPNGDAFAADLARYLAHEPLDARRWSFATLAKKWVRRNPRLAVGILVLAIAGVVAGVATVEYERQSRLLEEVQKTALAETAARAVTEGVLHLARGSIAAARVQFKNALSLDPQSVEAELLLALASSKSERPEVLADSLRRLDGVIRQRPWLAGAYILRGMLLARHGDPRGAEVARARAERLTSRLPVEIYLRAVIARESGRLDDALALFDQAVLERPQAIEYVYSRQRCFLEMGDPRRAYGDAWLIVHTAPKDPWAHRNLGDVSLVMGAPEDALMAYDEALRLDPVDREAKLRRCFALTLLGRGQGASAELQGLATGLSSDAIVWSARALALLRSGDAEARNFAERAAFLDGRDPYVRRALADSVLETGEPAEAMELYAGISAHPVLSACAAYGTALAFLSGGDVKGAATALQKARRPIHLVADDWVPGLFWIRPVPGKESTEAVALAERLVTSTARRDPLALGTLAATLRRAGRGEEARRVAAEAAVIPAPLLIQAALRLLVLTLDPEDRPEVVVSEAG